MAKYNPNEAQFSDAVLKINAIEINAKARSYGDSMEFSELEGASRMITGRTAGSYKTDESTFEMYLSDYEELVKALGAKFFTEEFTATVTYSRNGSTVIDTLEKCRMTKRAASDSAGTEGLTRSVTLKPLYIKWNGVNPLETMPTGA